MNAHRQNLYFCSKCDTRLTTTVNLTDIEVKFDVVVAESHSEHTLGVSSPNVAQDCV